MDVVGGQHPTDNVDTFLCADLSADVAHPKANIAGQHLVTILCRPDDVVAMVENTVAAGVVLHVLTFWKMSLRPAAAHFPEGKDIRSSIHAKAGPTGSRWVCS